MKIEDARAAIAYLAQCTPGWSQEGIEQYAEQCVRFPDAETLMAAVKKLCMRWDRRTRPLPYDITSAYNAEKSERDLDDRYALTEGYDAAVYPTFKEGVAIAWQAYQDECRRQGKEPSRAYFEQWLPAP